MNRNQNSVAAIIAFLAQGNQILTEEMAAFACAYHEECQQANRRLFQCHDYCSRGLIVESFHLAEQSPDLFELILQLNFRRLPQWEEVCDLYDLPFEPLRHDLARSLNEAYTEDRTELDALLTTFRALNLARAPVAMRLACLRKIHRHEPGSPFWAEDVEALEVERHEQVHRDAKKYRRKPDMDGLYCLLEEAEECRWLLPLPEPTHTLIRDGIAKGRRQGSLITSHRAGHLIQQMQQAVDRGDVHAARRYASRWRKQKTSIRLPPDAPSRSSGNRLASRIESGRLPVIPRQVDQPSTIQCPFCKTELAIDSKLSSQQFFCSCGQLLQMRSRSATRGVT